jgi:hypothetical protein
MKKQVFDSLMKQHPPTLSMSAAQPGWVLALVWLDGETFYKGGIPVVAWVARNDIHPDIVDAGALARYCALVLDDEFGLVESDDDLLEAGNGRILGIKSQSWFDAYDPAKDDSTQAFIRDAVARREAKQAP